MVPADARPCVLLVLLLVMPPPALPLQAAHSYSLLPDGSYRYSAAPSLLHLPGRGQCVVEEVPALNLTFPRPWTLGAFCTHPTYLRQECCPGRQIAALQLGCPVVKVVEGVVGTAAEGGQGAFFVQQARTHGLPDLLQHQGGATTLLLPRDQVLAEEAAAGRRTVVMGELRRMVEVEVEGEAAGSRRWEVPALLLYHLLPRRWYTRHLHHGQLLPTRLEGHPVRVAVIRGQMVLFNCVAMTRMDVHARDGVVHVLARPLPPAYAGTLTDLVAADPRLSSFFTVLAYGRLLGLVRGPGPLTVLAPSNAAFAALPRRYLDSLTYDPRYFPALQALGQEHLVEGAHCSLELTQTAGLTTVAGTWHNVSCSGVATLSVGPPTTPAALTTPDAVASNGVLHYIDRVLIPDKALSLVQAARRAGATRFVQLLRRAGLFLQLVSYGPYTVFAPSNQALQGVRKDVATDRKAVRRLLQYHVAEGSHASFTLADNQVLPTRLPGTVLRVKVSPKTVAVEAGLVTHGDHVAFNGYVHVLDRLLTPPEHTVARALAAHPHLDRFTALLTQGSVWAWRELSRGAGPYTVLAVRDADMDRWASDTFTYYRLIHDPGLLNQSLGLHVLGDLVLPRAVEEGSTTLLRPLHSGRVHRLTRTHGHLSLNHASLSPDFLLCTNGVILFVDALLLP